MFSTASRLNERAENPRAFRVLTIAKTAPVVARGGVGRLAGEELAKMTARQMDYPWTSGDA
ncbi:MAG: hypothetical protein B6A08_13130 [Sorangiineae bacterium NIC37A_2]|nr:MAG: hypothetical protein B6A08_13130 [Sorangiineae bacterium NIC37A_2]